MTILPLPSNPATAKRDPNHAAKVMAARDTVIAAAAYLVGLVREPGCDALSVRVDFFPGCSPTVTCDHASRI